MTVYVHVQYDSLPAQRKKADPADLQVLSRVNRGSPKTEVFRGTSFSFSLHTWSPYRTMGLVSSYITSCPADPSAHPPPLLLKERGNDNEALTACLCTPL